MSARNGKEAFDALRHTEQYTAEVFLHATFLHMTACLSIFGGLYCICVQSCAIHSLVQSSSLRNPHCIAVVSMVMLLVQISPDGSDIKQCHFTVPWISIFLTVRRLHLLSSALNERIHL